MCDSKPFNKLTEKGLKSVGLDQTLLVVLSTGLLVAAGGASGAIATDEPTKVPEVTEREPAALPWPTPQPPPAGSVVTLDSTVNLHGYAGDDDLDRLFTRADEFAAKGRYDLAVELWQRVLNESTDTVTTRDDWVHRTTRHEYRNYRSVSGEVERSLAKLPAAGLRVYRATVDGEARAILAAGEDYGKEQDDRADPQLDPANSAPRNRRERALGEVVGRFFLSSYGDDAAFELACLRMERREFVTANRLLKKVLQEYPDSNVPNDQVLSRLAVASARIGDQETARKMLTQLEESASVSLQHVSSIRHDVERHAKNRPAAVSPGAWRMCFGNPSRSGCMKALSPETSQSPVTELWSKRLEIETLTLGNREAIRATGMPRGRGGIEGFKGILVEDVLRGRLDDIGVFRTGPGVSVVHQSSTVASGSIIERWERTIQNPAAALLLDQGRVYLKEYDRLICCDETTGDVIWRGRRNQYQLDPLLQYYRDYRVRAPARRRAYSASSVDPPVSASELVLFWDRVRQSMSITGDLILNVEGKLLDPGSPTTFVPLVATDVESAPTGLHRVRTNWLAAYEAKSGEVRWRRSAIDGQTASNEGVGFLAAPIPCLNLLLAPVTDNGQLWVYGMAGENGKTVWKTRLCDEPPGGSSRWSSVGIAVDGGDAYVASGSGVAFALDASTGALHWATTYPRSRQQHAHYTPGVSPVELAQFGEDVVIPHGKCVVVMASDSNQVVAFDRRTGEFLWESPVKPSDDPTPLFSYPSTYCLGVVGDSLYVADLNNVRQYSISSGRLGWDTNVADSFGRGALTETAIYVPLKESILQLDLQTGAVQQRTSVLLPNDEPVGNLYSNGERLLVVGLERVYALGQLTQYLEELAERIEQGDGRAQLTRAPLLARTGSLGDAIVDLREGYGFLLENAPASANNALYDAMFASKVDIVRPLVSLELLLESTAASETNSAASQSPDTEATSKRSAVLYRSLKSLHDKGLDGATALLLDVAPLCTDDRLRKAARQAMAVTVSENDEAILQKSLGSSDNNVRAVSAAGLTSSILRERSAPRFKKMLTSEDEAVRLIAARCLADLGDRSALPALGLLLASPDLQIRTKSVRILRALSDRQFNYSPNGPIFDRLAATSRWMKWIDGEGKTASLSFPIENIDLEGEEKQETNSGNYGGGSRARRKGGVF